MMGCSLKRDGRCRTHGGSVAVLVGVLLLWWSFPAKSYVLRDETHGTQLSLFGLGMIRFNYAMVDGNVNAFETGEASFRDGFDTQEFLSLRANGTLWRNYGLESEIRYSREDDPDWYFHVKLMRDAHYLLFGDQPNMFTDTYFTRYSTPFRGLTVHLESDQFQTTTFGALTRGTLVKEELLPNGTSGPYTVEKYPVAPGSEVVTLEVRNQYDPEQVLERIPQERNVDYTIDYDTGEITFTQPVNSETFQGNPVIIVVRYRSNAESSAFNTAVMGGRAAVSPTSWATMGMTYVAEAPYADESLSESFESRHEVYGIDSTVTLGDALKLTTEYAFSQDLAATDTNGVAQAFRADLTGKIGAQFELSGQYQRAERDFLTFANPDINPDHQELALAGKCYYRPKQYFEAGYSFLQDNLPPDAANPTTTTHRPYVGWNAYVREHTQLFSKYEYIQITDDQAPKLSNQFTHIFSVGGVQEFLHVPVAKKLALRAEYQRSDFEDETNATDDTITHQVGVQLKSTPVTNSSVYAEQRERIIYAKEEGEYTERQDISEIGADLKHWERFSLQTKYRYQANYNLRNDARLSDSHTVILRPEYTPLTDLVASGKLELREDTTYATEDAGTTDTKGDTTTRTLNTEGRLTYTPKKDLTIRLKYTYQQTEDIAAETITTREDSTEFRVNYAFDQRKTRLTAVAKLERDLLDAPPTKETDTRTITYLVSAARQFTDRWDGLVQYKREINELAADDTRDDVLCEIGYNVGKFVKFVGGYQYTNFLDDTEEQTPGSENDDYTAQSVYVKLIGKL